MGEDPQTPEEMKAYAERWAQLTYGMSLEALNALSVQERVQLAYDKGVGFAVHGVAIVGRGGKPVTEQETKVLRVDFGPPTNPNGQQERVR